MVAVCGSVEGVKGEVAAGHKGEGKSVLIVLFI
jgi:hypothetical protein